MRDLLYTERKIITKLISARKENHYEYMQFAYILRNNVQYDYLKWDISDERSSIETFYKDGTEKDQQDVFYKIIDLIGFFEELKERGYVMIVQLNKSNQPYPRYHYDKNKYELDEILGICIKSNKRLYPIFSEGDNIYKYYGLIVNKIEKYLDSIIYPLQPIIDYSKNFKSIGQRRSDKQNSYALIGIIIAIIIGIFSPFITQWISGNGESEKLERIEAGIEDCKKVSIDSIGTMSADSFNMSLFQKVKSTPKPQNQ